MMSNAADLFTLRTPDEVQAAHDRLTAIVLGEVPNPFDGDVKAQTAMRAQLDVLCWLLRHDHNVTFSHNLREIDSFFRDCGLQLIDTGGLRNRNPEQR